MVQSTRPRKFPKSIRGRSDLTEEEKQTIIDNAYRSVAGGEGVLPEWVSRFGIKHIRWDDGTSIVQTAKEVEEYFGFGV